MFISFEDMNTHYSSQSGTLDMNYSYLGKDFNTLNPSLDPVKVMFGMGQGEYQELPYPSQVEQGTWNVPLDESGTLTTVYVIQIQVSIPGAPAGDYPAMLLNVFTDETYRELVSVGDVSFVEAYINQEG